MPVLPKRAILGVLVVGVMLLVVGGFSSEASAQVFRGTITFEGGPPIDVTLTLVPGGPAVYVASFLGIVVDTGRLTANVAGNTVVGVIISDFYFPCQFQGTYDGTTAIFNLDPVTCGSRGTVILTRS
jgi:hypothetical protein